MLNWWLGKPEVQSATDEDNSEPPETPAPLFAARALKSAFFGTPAPPDDTPFMRLTEKTMEPVIDQQKAQLQNTSPIRPQGILMTPGTAALRRKSVSFGRDVKDKDTVADRQGKKAIRNRPTRSASLTKALEIAKEEKVSRTAQRNSVETSQSSNSGSDSTSRESQASSIWRKESTYLIKPDLLEELSRDDPDGDMTMDLNKPHSQSGRYWKSEFHKYHEEAQIQMRRLLQYKEGAKDFARKKDAEVLDLKQKLKESERKNAMSGDQMSTVSRRIAGEGDLGDEVDVDVSRLINELAKKNALCEQYKKQIDASRYASNRSSSREGKNLLSQDLLTMTAESDSLSQVKSLREEILDLQSILKKSQTENAKLQDENKRLKQDLSQFETKLERQVEKLERRRASFEDMRRKKDDALDQLQKTYDQLKENAKSQRRDAEQLLKRRHDQVAELKKELTTARQLGTKVEELQDQLEKSTAEHSRIVADYEIQIAELKRDVVLGDDTGTDLRASISKNPYLSRSLVKHVESPTRQRESQIPLASNSISRPLKAAARHMRSELPTTSPRKRTPPLSEIVNNADPSTIPSLRNGHIQFTQAVQHLFLKNT